MIDALRSIGFIGKNEHMDFHTGELDDEKNRGRDHVNYYLGIKKTKLNGKVYNIVFMGCIGSNMYQWYSNFDPLGIDKDSLGAYDENGSYIGKNHIGFNNAKNFAYEKLTSFLKKYGCTKNDTKIIITGHSRGAATANLISAKIIDENKIVNTGNLYAYTFATPNNTTNPQVSNARYNCIHNIVNPEDFVTHVMLKKWGYSKYGRIYVLPSKTNTNSKIYKTYLNSMNQIRQRIAEGAEDKWYEPYGSGEATTYNIIEKMGDQVPTIKQFYTEQYDAYGDKRSAFNFFKETLLPYVSNSDAGYGQKNMIKTIAWQLVNVIKLSGSYYKYMKNPFALINTDKFVEDIKNASMEYMNNSFYPSVILYFINPDVDISELTSALTSLAIDIGKASRFSPQYGIKTDWDKVDFGAFFNQVVGSMGLGGRFTQAHEMVTYCAYMMSLDSSVITAHKKSDYGEWNCPVDIEIYDNDTNEVVGRIVNNEIDKEIAAGENSVVMTVSGDTKSYWLPEGGNYTIRIIGNDSGKADYTMSTIESGTGEVSRVNYKDLVFEDGYSMNINIDAEKPDETPDLLDNNNMIVEPSEVIDSSDESTCSVKIAVEGDGSVNSISEAKKGDYISLYASGNCSSFNGWYDENSKLLSTETTYTFRVDGDVNLTAKFNVAQHHYEEETVNPSCIEEGYTIHRCSVCLDFYRTDQKPVTEHKYGSYISNKDATCSADGTKTAVCEICKYVNTVTDVGSKKSAHNYYCSDLIISDYLNVKTVLTCSECGDKQNVDSSVVSKQIVKPTCLTYGVKKYTIKASYGGKDYITTGEETIDKADHSYSTKWTVDSPATTGSSGSKSHHCTICDEKKDVTAIARIKSCELSNYSYFCDGKAKTPAVTVTDYNGNKLTVNKDYKLTYSSATRAAAGSYNVLITFMGYYSGTKTLYYSIYSTVKNLRKTEWDLNMVSLSWDALPGASGYKVYRKLSSDASYKQIAAVKTTTFTDKTVGVNKEYSYVVRPYNSYAVGTDSSSVYYSTVIGVPSIYVYDSDTGSLQINTYKASNAVGYELFRATSETGKYSLVKSSSYSTYYDTSLTVGKPYYYKARSVAFVNGKKYYSDYSNVKSATVALSTPPSPRVSVSGDTSVRLSWDAMPDVTGYYVYRSESSYGSYNYIGATTATAYTDKNLTTGKYYYYKISSYKTVSGNKVFSSMSSYSSAVPSFTYPYNVSVTNSSLTAHTVSWARPSGAKGVELSVSVGNSYSYNVVGEFTSSSYTNKNVDHSLTYYYKLRSYKIVSGVKEYSGYTTISYRSLLPQVSGLKATNLSATSIRLSWNKVSNATIYYIYRASSRNGSYSMIGSTESTRYDITDLTLDSRHFYKVEARRSVNGITNYGIASNPVCKVVLIPATAITSITNVSSTSMKITWKKVDGATSYSLYRSTSKSSGFSLVKSGITTTSYTDTKLTYGKTYYYKLKTVYTVSGISNISDYSSLSSRKVVLVPPALTAAANSLTSIKLTWTKDAGVTGYEIYRSTSSGGKYTKIKVITKASTYSYVDNSLTPGKTYYYKIRAYKTVNKKNEYSSSSNAAYAKASPQMVTGVVASGITTTSVKLSWKSAAGAKYYKIEQYNPSTKKWQAIKTVTSTTYTVTKLSAGTSYAFRITAIDCTKKISGKASATLKTATLTVAPTVKLASTKSKTATVSWNSVKGAKTYIVYQSYDGKTWTKVATTKTSYTITNLTGGKRIYIKVRAVNIYNLYSAYSATKYVTVMK